MSEPIESPATHEDPLKNWMKGLGEIDTTPTPAAEPGKEITDGTTNAVLEPGDDAVGNAPAAVPPKPAPVVDTKPVEPVKPPEELAEDKWPRTAQEWKKFKEARKQAVEERDGKINTLQTELEEVRKKITEAPKASPELDDLRKERDDLSDRLRTLDVERHPKFKAYFENKTKNQVELAKRIVGTEQATTAEKLLSLPDGDYKTAQIEELMLNLTPLQQSRFGSVLNSLAEIDSERQGEITRGRENYEKMVAEQQAGQQQRVSAIEKAFNDAALRAQDAKEGRLVYQKRENDHDWNKSVEQRLETARNLFFGKNVKSDQVISAALDAAALPAILSGYEALHNECETLRAQVAELSKAAPSLRPGSAPADAQPQRVQIRVGTRPDEAIAGWVKSLHQDE